MTIDELLLKLRGGDDRKKSDSIRMWLLKDGRNTPLEQLEGLLVTISNDEEQYKVIKTWLDGKEITLAQCNTLLRMFQRDRERQQIISVWLRTDEGKKASLQQYHAFLREVQNGQARVHFIRTLLLRDAGENISLEQFCTFLETLQNYDEKAIIITTLLGRQRGTRLATIIEHLIRPPYFDRYDRSSMANLLEELPLASLPGFITGLYPNNELMQIELLKEATLTQDHTRHLITFFQGMHDDSLLLEGIELVSSRRLLTPQHLLTLAQGRIHHHYASLKEGLSLPLAEAISEEGMNTLRGALGNNTITDAMPLSSIVGYYMINDQLGQLRPLLKEGVWEQLKERFTPSAEKPYVTTQEAKKLFDFLDVELPTIAPLAQWLHSEVPPIPELSKERLENYRMNLTGSRHQGNEELNADFRALLSAAEPEAAKVAEFIQTVISLDAPFNADDAEKLKQCFCANRKEFAALFEKDGGIEKFAVRIGALGHGCVANITTQMRIALYEALIDDPVASKLFPLYANFIAMPLLNTGDHIGGAASGTQTDILQNPYLLTQHLSPNGLVALCVQDLAQQKNEITWDMLDHFLGTEKKGNLFFTLEEMKDDRKLTSAQFNTISTELAVYHMLEKNLPELAKSPYLAELAEGCKGMMDDPLFTTIAEALTQKSLPSLDTHAVKSALKSAFKGDGDALLEKLELTRNDQLSPKVLESHSVLREAKTLLQKTPSDLKAALHAWKSSDGLSITP